MPELPINADDGARASPSPAGETVAHSPGKMRKLARRTLQLPLDIKVPKLPPCESLSAGTLLAWHAGALTLANNFTDKRRRVVGKQLLSIDTVLVALAADPEHHFRDTCFLWRQRLAACNSAAAIFASAYTLKVRESRKPWHVMWKAAGHRVRENWTLLASHPGYRDLVEPALESNKALPVEESEVECCGALLTWQTVLGHGDDPVTAWLDRGIAAHMVVELMQEDPFCKAWFERFRASVVSMLEERGMVHYACCLELSTSQQKAVVHAHAYVAPNWNPLPNGEKRKVKIAPDDWTYEGYRPHVQRAVVRRNGNAKKVVTVGMFYCSVNKIGSVFRSSNATPGKD